MKRKFEPNHQTKSAFSFWHNGIWSHIELGSGNYGKNVHADSTHTAIGQISDKQFNLLFITVDELIEKKGNKGMIYINDLEEGIVRYTIKKLQNYIKNSYPDSEITLKPLVGDFFKIEMPIVNTIHLKNPEKWFFKDLIKNKDRLKYFADHSKEGLILATYFEKEFMQLMTKLEFGIRSKVLNNNYYPYIHADGAQLNEGNVVQYLILSPDNAMERLRAKYAIIVEETNADSNNDGYQISLGAL